MIGSVVGGLLLVCLLYCLIAPNQYEASAEVAVRTTPATSLSLEGAGANIAASVLSAPVQQETLANVFRSHQLAWRVIDDLKLYRAPGFKGSFNRRFPGFKPDVPGTGAQAWLLERFEQRLHVQTLPRTLLIQIRFRSRDAALSAAVVNDLIRAYGEQESEARMQATTQASEWLESQLRELKARVDRDEQRLAAFQSEHGILSTPETLANGQQGETQHITALLEIDELGRQLVAATTDRILREAEYRAASQGDPELVVASDPRLQAEDGNFATALLKQVHARQSELEQEEAQLRIEHGPNFPRVVEIRGQLQDLDRQMKAEDAKLVGRFRSAWQTAQDREQMVRKSLEERTGEGMKLNQAATQYAVMRQEANTSRELYMRVLEKVEEAGLAAGVHSSNIEVVDPARPPAKPVAPDLPLYMAITLFAGLWVAAGGALLMESLGSPVTRTVALLVAVALAGPVSQAQAPTPSTSGLPTGVAHYPQTPERKDIPNAKEAPAIWNDAGGANQTGLPPMATALSATPMPAPIGPGDMLDVSEYHTPEFHSLVRVSDAGTVMLPMVGEVKVLGMDETGAARAIEKALLAKGMLLHPQVTVMVTAYVGQDVSVLGEVTRPGVYPYTAAPSAAGCDFGCLGVDVLGRTAGECVSSRRSAYAASGGAGPGRNGDGDRSQPGARAGGYGAGEPGRAGVRDWRCGAAGRISRGSGAGADGGAGAVAGMGADAECGIDEGIADSGAEWRPNADDAQPETPAAGAGSRPADSRPRHSLRAGLDRPRTC